MSIFRKLSAALLISIASSVPTVVCAQADFAQPFIAAPSEVKFAAPAATAGITSAVLIGDPKSTGLFVTRIRIPANFKIQPHTHPDMLRTITVLSGTYYFAYGDTFDESKLRALGPGSIYTEPKDLAHFAATKEEEVVLQITAQGPTGTNPVRK